MNEYKSVTKFLNKNEEKKTFKSIIKTLLYKVFNEKFVYKDISIYKNGYKLEVDNDYYIPLIESGVVVFVGENKDYGKTVIIEQVDGVCVTYGNLSNLNVNLYDYVSKGEFLGSSNGSYLYLVFEKDGKYLKYNDFI